MNRFASPAAHRPDTSSGNEAFEHDALRLAPVGEHRRTVIWLHGVGQDGRLLEASSRQLHRLEDGVLNVFPHARERQRLDADTDLPTWFQQSFVALQEIDEAGLERAVHRIDALVDAEAELVGPDRIVLAGFSQGAALALIVGLRRRQPIGGMMLFAPFFLPQANLRKTRTLESLRTKIWIGHGDCDRIVSPAFSEKIVQLLQGAGYAVDYRRYPESAHAPFDGVRDSDLAHLF